MRISAAAAGLVLMISACEVSQPPAVSGVVPELGSLSVPDSVFLQETAFGPVTVVADDPQGLEDITAVLLLMTSADNPAVTVTDTLNDEGRKGDTVARDGIFSSLPSIALLQQQTGAYTCTVTAQDMDGNSSDPLFASFIAIDAEANDPPHLYNAQLPDSLDDSGLRPFTAMVRVSDNRGAADIDSVWFDLFAAFSLKRVLHGRFRDDGGGGDAVAGDSLFTFSGDVSGKVRTGGQFRLRLQAVDRNGLLSNVIVNDLYIDLPDGPPVLFNLSAPDTISRIDGDEFLISVQASDPLGLDDIEQVYFNVTLPSGGQAAGNPFLLYDDGTAGDETAGDGIYSLTSVININNNLGDYQFVFQARDISGALSNELIHIITVVN